MWKKKNNNGEGFCIGVEGQDINNLNNSHYGELIKKSNGSHDVAVYYDCDSDRFVLVAEGPWDVDVLGYEAEFQELFNYFGFYGI